MLSRFFLIWVQFTTVRIWSLDENDGIQVGRQLHGGYARVSKAMPPDVRRWLRPAG